MQEEEEQQQQQKTRNIDEEDYIDQIVGMMIVLVVASCSLSLSFVKQKEEKN